MKIQRGSIPTQSCALSTYRSAQHARILLLTAPTMWQTLLDLLQVRKDLSFLLLFWLMFLSFI